MLIGVPKEIKTHEHEVGLTPVAVREYVAAALVSLLKRMPGALSELFSHRGANKNG